MNTIATVPAGIDREIDALLRAVYATYGYDFRGYEKASQKRRVLSFLRKMDIESVPEAKQLIAGDRDVFFEFLGHVTVPTTELFRDPLFYRTFVTRVVPVLRTYAAIKVWHAGCSSGEEVYSMTILLHQLGLLENAVMYATDVDRAAICQSRKGIVPSRVLKRDTHNYLETGLESPLHDYWHTKHGFALLRPVLLENVVFSEHNLATDASFGEMHVIVCRNVLIYFDRELQDRVLELLVSSLVRGGFLCLGPRESVQFSSVAAQLDVVDREARIYRKRSHL